MALQVMPQRPVSVAIDRTKPAVSARRGPLARLRFRPWSGDAVARNRWWVADTGAPTGRGRDLGRGTVGRRAAAGKGL